MIMITMMITTTGPDIFVERTLPIMISTCEMGGGALGDGCWSARLRNGLGAWDGLRAWNTLESDTIFWNCY